VVKVYLHSTLPYDDVFAAVRHHVARLQFVGAPRNASGVRLYCADANDASALRSELGGRSDIVVLPSKFSATALSDQHQVSNLASLGIKKGDTMSAALATVFAASSAAPFDPDGD
jgi:hypothetical protein